MKPKAETKLYVLELYILNHREIVNHEDSSLEIYGSEGCLMPVHIKYSLAALLALVGLLVGSAAQATELNYQHFAAALEQYVDDTGLVYYQGLKANPQELKEFVTQVDQLDRAVYEQWGDQTKIAFWINAYNALTLQAIIDNYPIQVSFWKAAIYPKNSIRQINGVWDELQFGVMGKKMTLDEIEHNVLRAEFNEPGIHIALVCAAIGCPPLRNEPYSGKHLDAQLNDQARKFLNNPIKFRLDTRTATVALSPIFKWFGADFVKTYGTDKRFSDRSDPERAVLNFISAYLDDGDLSYLTTGAYSIDYLDYDWSLNERTSGLS